MEQVLNLSLFIEAALRNVAFPELMSRDRAIS